MPVILFESTSLEREYFYSAVEEYNASQSFSSDVICEEDYEDVFDEYSSLCKETPEEMSSSRLVRGQVDSSLEMDLPPSLPLEMDLPPPLPLRFHQIRAPARPPVPHA